jgi:hypothetical protein
VGHLRRRHVRVQNQTKAQGRVEGIYRGMGCGLVVEVGVEAVGLVGLEGQEQEQEGEHRLHRLFVYDNEETR